MLEQNLIKHPKFLYSLEIALHQLFYRQLGTIAITEFGSDLPLVVKKEPVFTPAGQEMQAIA